MSDDTSLVPTGSDNQWIRATVVFALGGGLLLAFLWLVGVGEVQRALADVPPRRLVSLVAVSVVPVVLWGAGFHLLLVRFGVAGRFGTSLLLFSASTFLNSVTPFGQAGGDPISAALIRRLLPTDFETGLAAIGSLNALNHLASLSLGLVGVGYLGTRVAFGHTLQVAAVVAVVTTAAVLGGVVVARLYHRTLIRSSAAGLARVLAPVGRLPGVTSPSRDDLVGRGRRFVEAVGRLADTPGTLGLLFLAGVAGQLAVASALWVALAALGVGANFAVVLLLIPVARLSGATPTPGGFGSSEAVLAALVVATVGADAAVAGAAALLYRASAFWLPSLCGGLATAWCLVCDPDPRQSGADSTAGVEMDTQLGTAVLLVVSAALVLPLAAVVHSKQLLVEPDSLLVHTTRDSALLILGFGTVWLTLRQAVAAHSG